MQSTKSKQAKKKMPTIRKYDNGYFIDANNLNSETGQLKRNQISGGVNTLSGLLSSTQDQRHPTTAGGALTGGLSGAAMGYQNFGLIGAGVGLIGGAISGAIGAGKRQRQIQEQDKAIVSNQLQQVDNTMTHSNINPYGTQMYEDGDMIEGNPNNQPTPETVNTQQNVINIQKGELLIHPETGKILQEFSGINPLTGGKYESHAKGRKKESPDNFTMADPGLFVITKKTAKQYKESLDNNDKISQKTVLMNIRNAKIAKNGGLKNYAYGDTVQDYDPLSYLGIKQFGVNNIPNTNSKLPYRDYSQIPTNTSIVQNPGLDQTIPTGNTNIRPIDSGISAAPKFGIGNVLDNLNKYGPSLINLAQGTFGNVATQPYAKPITNPYRDQVIANMPKDIDLSPMINDIRSNQNVLNKDLQNNTNNSAVYRANRQQINANTDKATTNARLLSQTENNKIASQRGAIYNDLGLQDMQDSSQRRQYDLGVDDINARRQAAKQNLFNAGLSQLQQTTMNDKSNKQKASLDKYTLGLMSQIFPNLKYYDEFDADKINKKLGR